RDHRDPHAHGVPRGCPRVLPGRRATRAAARAAHRPGQGPGHGGRPGQGRRGTGRAGLSRTGRRSLTAVEVTREVRMRRAPWLLPALASLLAVCGTATASPSPSDGEDRVPKLLSGRGVLAEHHWRGPAPTAPKVPTLGFVREQGGLWRLDVPADAGGELRTVRGREDAPRPADRVATVRVEV